MGAREHVTREQLQAWVCAEALVTGWLVLEPYAHARNMSGCPDVLLARNGTVLAVWCRTGSDPNMTGKQKTWAAGLLNDCPTPQDTTVANGNVQGLLLHPHHAAYDKAREVLG